MKKVKNLLICLLLVSILTVSLSLTAFAEGNEHDISSGNLAITEDGEYTVTGSTTTNKITVASGVTATIVLNGVDITLSSGVPILTQAGSNVTLVLNNENQVTGGICGIQIGGSFTVQGTGSLTAASTDWAAINVQDDADFTMESGTVTAKTVTAENAYNFGLFFGDNAEVTFSGGKFIANAENADEQNYGITGGSYNGSVIIKDGAEVETTAKGIENEGICSASGIWAPNLAIDGAKLTATASGADYENRGIAGNHLTITNSTVVATATGGEEARGIDIIDSDTEDGNINITDSDITATASNATFEARGISAYGGYEKENGTITITNSTIEATADGSGDYTDGIFGVYVDIVSGSVTATGKNANYNAAISAEKRLNMQDGTIIATASGNNATGIEANTFISSGGTVEVTATGIEYAQGFNGVNFEVTDGDVTLNASGGTERNEGIRIYKTNNNGSVNISGGTLTTTATGGQQAHGISTEEANVTISGGKVIATGSGDNITTGIFTNQGTISISGGTVDANGSTYNLYSFGPSAAITIIGGTVNGSVMRPAPTNGQEAVYEVVIPNAANVAKVTVDGVEIPIDGANEDGQLHLYLPVGANNIEITNKNGYIYRYENIVWDGTTPNIGKLKEIYDPDYEFVYEDTSDSSSNNNSNNDDDNRADNPNTGDSAISITAAGVLFVLAAGGMYFLKKR